MDPRFYYIAAIIIGIILLMFATYIYTVELFKLTSVSSIPTVGQFLFTTDSNGLVVGKSLYFDIWTIMAVLGLVGVTGGLFMFYKTPAFPF
jgi:hypothetical protein